MKTPISPKEILIEWIKTYSNKPSFFASKRIERSLVFLAMIAITIWYLEEHLQTISATDLCFVIGTWLGYAGWNTHVLRKEKKEEATNEIDTPNT
jgi:hypothetical protein